MCITVQQKSTCLNPYSTGNEVVAKVAKQIAEANPGLNPYSTGNEVVA